MYYSFIIPIYNEEKTLLRLLLSFQKYHNLGNEIIFIDDGSTDGSNLILKRFKYINLIKLNKNYGKGVAIKIGLKAAKNKKILIYDGDLELRTNDVSKLMRLDKNNDINFMMGVRSKTFHPFKSGVDWGNFIFTFFVNMVTFSCHKDILCCAKSFYKDKKLIKSIKSKGFDIDVELSIYLASKYQNK